jgi:hypothetical protein
LDFATYLGELGLEDSETSRDSYKKKYIKDQIGCDVKGPVGSIGDEVTVYLVFDDAHKNQKPEKATVLPIDEAKYMCEKCKIDKQAADAIFVTIDYFTEISRESTDIDIRDSWT